MDGPRPNLSPAQFSNKALDIVPGGQTPVLDLRGPLPVPDIKPEIEKTQHLTPAQPQAKSETHRQRLLIRLSSLKSAHWLLGYPLGVVALVGTGLLSINLALGQWLVAGYALVALVFRINSRYSFGLGILALLSVPLFLLTGLEALAENYAVYTYYFLVVGTVSAVREMLHSRSNISA